MFLLHKAYCKVSGADSNVEGNLQVFRLKMHICIKFTISINGDLFHLPEMDHGVVIEAPQV